MNDATRDIYTEPRDIDVDTLSNLGPLRPLAGIWQGVRGLDVKTKAEGPKKQAYVERIELQPIDPQTNGPQLMYGLRCGDELCDTLVEELFRRYHPLADRLEICFAKRGSKSRTHAFRSAIEKAEARFESEYGVRRSAEVAIVASTPPENAGLQAVDYCLWALRRHYERDESRYVELIWEKVVEIEDMDRIEGSRKGVVYNKKRPLITDRGRLNKGWEVEDPLAEAGSSHGMKPNFAPARTEF